MAPLARRRSTPKPVLTALLSLVGFLGWRTRSALVAWLLLLAFAGEMVFVGLQA